MFQKLTIHVKPGSSEGPLVVPGEGGKFTVYVRERATDGKANKAVVKLLAGYLKVPKSHVGIVRGHRSRYKVVQIGA